MDCLEVNFRTAHVMCCPPDTKRWKETSSYKIACEDCQPVGESECGYIIREYTSFREFYRKEFEPKLWNGWSPSMALLADVIVADSQILIWKRVWRLLERCKIQNVLMLNGGFELAFVNAWWMERQLGSECQDSPGAALLSPMMSEKETSFSNTWISCKGCQPVDDPWG